eukprot:gene12367-16590_t
MLIISLFIVLCAICFAWYQIYKEDTNQIWLQDLHLFRFFISFQNSNFNHSKGITEILATDHISFVKQDQISFIPIIFKNYTHQWSAHEKWKKAKLIQLYGTRTISIGSESSIVYGGGVANTPIRLEDVIKNFSPPIISFHHQLQSKLYNILQSLNLYHSTIDYNVEVDDSFVFDTTILKSIPELLNDIQIPSMFRSWDNQHAVSSKFVWHLLSLGPSRSGLPFHSHGKTWLAVIHGMKWWLVYPPQFSIPQEIQSKYNPMLPMRLWIKSIYPLLSKYPHLPENTYRDLKYYKEEKWHNIHKNNENKIINDTSYVEYRPLEILQMPGDVLYLPDGWHHMTINIGETIAIGGQSSFPARSRYKLAEKILSLYPNSFEANKDMALGLAHITIEDSNHIKSLLGIPNYNSKYYNKNNHYLLKINDNNYMTIINNLIELTGDICQSLKYDNNNNNKSKNAIQGIIYNDSNLSLTSIRSFIEQELKFIISNNYNSKQDDIGSVLTSSVNTKQKFKLSLEYA